MAVVQERGDEDVAARERTEGPADTGNVLEFEAQGESRLGMEM